ncbi:MAG: hydroxyacid dehydrogenase [Saprospiraceae bacterium]|nr:hydroxyacid dehydrogenase [Saprospiraceae bacterium]
MMHKDVLITDYVHPVLLEGLQSMGFSTTYAPEMSRKEMNLALDGYKGVVINTRCAIDRATLGSASALRWIARLGSGLDIIDLEAAAEKGIAVISAPEGNAQAVAEHAMGMLLALSNKLVQADRSVRDGQWLRELHRGWEIAGKTIGIIGFGNNGSAFGKLWKGWDVRVLAYDKFLVDYGTDHVTIADLETLLQQSDIISLHIPLTNETREMVDADFISKCKSGVILINTSRGKNINLDDVVSALRSGHLGGVCLDVFPFEPPSLGNEDFQKVFEELCQMENVVLSPHIAGWTVESKRKIAEILLRKISLLPG